MEQVAEYQSFVVRKSEPRPGRTTPIYHLINRRTKATIGSISWHGTWKQFCFFPGGDTVWTTHCLADIRSFLGQAAKERTAAVRKRYTGD